MDIFDVDSLLAQLVTALGAALAAGNAFALIQDHRGRRPAKAAGELRRSRAVFLLVVGLVIALWGVVTLAI